MAHDVFISHSSKDKTVADAVCGTLEKQGIRCWIAPRDIPPGQSWPAAIVEAISNSKVFVLILSDISNQSKQVTTEVGEAFDNGIPIVPLRIDDVKPSQEMGYYIKSIHWLDAMTPPMEHHINKLAESVEALLSVEEKDRLPTVEPVYEAPVKKRWPLPTWAIALLLITAVLIVGGVGSWAISRMNSAIPLPTPIETSSPIEVIPPTITATSVEAGEDFSDATQAPDSLSEWRPLSFVIPNPENWRVAGDNQYTAIEQRDTDAFAWSTESYQGDIMVSLDLRSSVEALDLSWDEMAAQIPSPNSGCAIIYGDGNVHSYGSLIFCVDWDGYYFDKHTRYHEREPLAFIPSTNKSDKVYSVTIEIIGDLASMYVNGEKVLSTFFDTEEIDRSGRIGLFRNWAEGEIKFSNIQIKTPGDGD
jgi:hypothetical protein